MKHLQGTQLWRADRTFLRAIKVTVKDSEKQIDCEDKKITEHSHFTDEFSAWKKLKVMMDARHMVSMETKHFSEEKAHEAARELNAARDDYIMLLSNMKQAGISI